MKKESSETAFEMGRRGGTIDTDEPYRTQTSNNKPKRIQNPNLEGQQGSQATQELGEIFVLQILIATPLPRFRVSFSFKLYFNVSI